MCGICGIIGPARDRTARVEKMIKAMDHRGPDDHGIMDNPHLTLGMTRLAILDTSSSAHQPMSNTDKTIWLVYNGEMYNFREEKEILQNQGYNFTSTSDTEVVLKMYEAYGDNFVKRIRGMFALAIYDNRPGQSQKVLLARGPLGIKPLLYSQQGKCLVFASEIKAMLASGLVSKQIDPEALRTLLSYGSVIQPKTILSGVNALLPGYSLTLINGGITITRFWRFDLSQAELLRNEPYEQLVARVREQLEETTKMHLVSDVPIGAFLSGGVDSAVMVGLFSQFSSTPVKTFSVGFGVEGQAIDETIAAAKIAEHFHTDHTRLEITGSDIKKHLSRIAWALDQPSVDGVNSYFVSLAAKSKVTVALSGTGGDEIFAGYSWFLNLAKEYAHPSPRAQLAKQILARLASPTFWDRIWMSRLSFGADRLRGGQSFLHKFIREYQIYRGYSAEFLLAPALRKGGNWPVHGVADFAPADELSNASVIPRVSALCLRGYTQNQLMRDIDAVSMAHSLEVRVPYLDTKLINLVLSLPDYTKLNPLSYPSSDTTYRATGAKRILIDATRDLLPPDIDLQEKKGFGLPFDAWLRGPLQEEMDSLLSPTTILKRGLFDPKRVAIIKDKFLAGQLHWSFIWLLMIIELWCQEVLDQ